MQTVTHEKTRKPNSLSENKLFVCFSLFFISFISLLICSKCSFIYPFNDWYDANILFTMGKGLIHGKTLYVDLMDQKGPYPYLLYGIAYLISHKSFLGLFFTELISLTSFLLVIKSTVSLYSKKDFLFLYPVIAFVTVSSSAFVHGGSVEEFSLPLIAYSVYLALKLARNKDLKFYEMLLAGVFAGVLFWSKFTLCGSFLGFALSIIIVYIKERKIAKIFSAAAVFISGCIVSSLPWFIYFAFKKAVPVFLNSYLLSNTFEYTNEAEMTLFTRIISIIKVSVKFYSKKGNLFLTFLVLIGLTAFMFLSKKRASLIEKIICIMMFLIVNFGVFFSGEAHGYYGLVAAAFISFACISLTVLIDDKIIKKVSFLSKPYPAVITLAAGIALAFLISDNTYLLKYKKAELPQYKFAEIINGYDDKSLLNYRFLDGGFYTVLGTMPEIKEYCALNRNFNEIVDTQKEYLAEGKTNFVVTWYEFPIDINEICEKFPEVAENYEIAASDQYLIESGFRTYTLWVRKQKGFQ